MDRQNELARRLKYYIKKNGIKQKHIAEELGLCPSLLSRVINCKYEKPLWKSSLDKIKKYLSEHENK